MFPADWKFQPVFPSHESLVNSTHVNNQMYLVARECFLCQMPISEHRTLNTEHKQWFVLAELQTLTPWEESLQTTSGFQGSITQGSGAQMRKKTCRNLQDKMLAL